MIMLTLREGHNLPKVIHTVKLRDFGSQSKMWYTFDSRVHVFPVNQSQWAGGRSPRTEKPLPSVNCCGGWRVTVTLRPTQPVAETAQGRHSQAQRAGVTRPTLPWTARRPLLTDDCVTNVKMVLFSLSLVPSAPCSRFSLKPRSEP